MNEKRDTLRVLLHEILVLRDEDEKVLKSNPRTSRVNVYTRGHRDGLNDVLDMILAMIATCPEDNENG